MLQLDRVADEYNEKIFRTVLNLINNLSGGCNDDQLYDDAIEILRESLAGLDIGSDNEGLVTELRATAARSYIIL